jgi:hypothetical protein
MIDIANKIEELITHRVKEVLDKKDGIPELPLELAVSDNLGEVIEKLVILHIRTWFLEDMAGIAKTDSELADIKRKVDICFKQKRPMYVQAINKMVDAAIKDGKTLREDSVKVYKNFDTK